MLIFSEITEKDCLERGSEVPSLNYPHSTVKIEPNLHGNLKMVQDTMYVSIIHQYCISVRLILASEDSKFIRPTGLTQLGGLPLAAHCWLANASSNDCVSVTRATSSGGRLYVYAALAL